MSKKHRLVTEEELAWFNAVQDRIVEERLRFAPRGVPRRLLRAIAKDENIAVMYPTTTGNWLFVAADDGTYGQAEITHETFVAVLAWKLETERVLNMTLAHERL